MSASAREHAKGDEMNKPFGCDSCKKRFRTEYGATWHRKNAHGDEPAHSLPFEIRLIGDPVVDCPEWAKGELEEIHKSFAEAQLAEEEGITKDTTVLFVHACLHSWAHCLDCPVCLWANPGMASVGERG